jgi:hypothetical protein
MAAATKPASGALEASGGVSLAQVAAVTAAVTEGFPLADVLAVEGLKPRVFARADLAWKQRLVAEPELLAAGGAGARCGAGEGLRAAGGAPRAPAGDAPRPGAQHR